MTTPVLAMTFALLASGCDSDQTRLSPQISGGRSLKAQAAELLDTTRFDADLRFISSDLTEGRAPASLGEEITAEYLEARLRMAGAEGPFDGSFRQAVPLVMQRASAQMELHISGRGTESLYEYGPEFVVDSGAVAPRVDVDGEIVFVGYGSVAPEFEWDDYKGMDVSGKILMMLVNDPPATEEEPDLFEGKAMTYYGRWTYKYEIAEELGAQGVLLVHVTDMAGYGWNVVESSWSGDQFSLEGTSGARPLKMRGWVTREVAGEIVQRAGHDVDTLIESAARRDFQPIDLGVRAAATIRNTTSRMTAHNVVGVIRGSDDGRSDELVVYSAHLDHLGKREGEGDTIYNGAYDNSSGAAAVLNLADVLGRIPREMRPPRSFCFALVTAEESGLLGSAWFAQNPPVPSTQIVAAINLDGINLWGETDDLVLVGGPRSGIWDVVEAVARPMGMVVEPEPRPEVGSFFRSDHFSFAKVGIPATSLGAGEDYRGKPEGWGKEFHDRWTAETYHQPSDEYSEEYVYDGVLQVMQVALHAGLQIASSTEWIEWQEGDQFGRIRAEARRQGGASH
jgi:Zn-dependent M28 family amino/carboxypeptidase